MRSRPSRSRAIPVRSTLTAPWVVKDSLQRPQVLNRGGPARRPDFSADHQALYALSSADSALFRDPAGTLDRVQRDLGLGLVPGVDLVKRRYRADPLAALAGGLDSCLMVGLALRGPQFHALRANPAERLSDVR